MAKKKKQVPVNQIEKLITVPSEFTIEFGDINDPIEVLVKPRLSLKDRITFAYSIANAVTNILTESGETTVDFAVKDYLIKINTISYFTNIRIPENEDKRYSLVYDTDIYNRITTANDFDLTSFEDLVDATEDQILFEVAKIQNQFRVETQAYLEQMKAEASSIVSSFEKFAEAFKDVDVEDVANMIPKLANAAKIDEKTLVDAYLARANKSPDLTVVK